MTLVVARGLWDIWQTRVSFYEHYSFLFPDNVMTEKQSRWWGKNKSIAALSQVWLWIHQCNEKWWIHALVRKCPCVLDRALISNGYLTRQLPAHNYWTMNLLPGLHKSAQLTWIHACKQPVSTCRLLLRAELRLSEGCLNVLGLKMNAQGFADQSRTLFHTNGACSSSSGRRVGKLITMLM